MNEIGEMLHLTRESSGVSIEEASKDLNIKVEILENIEDGRSGAFKDMLELKDYIGTYAKYLGLDSEKIIDEFNEYMFEYTSKIPVKELEKTIELQIKDEDKKEKIASPYTKESKKYPRKIYIVLYVILVIIILLLILWSVKQVTIGKNVTEVISYKEKK